MPLPSIPFCFSKTWHSARRERADDLSRAVRSRPVAGFPSIRMVAGSHACIPACTDSLRWSRRHSRSCRSPVNVRCPTSIWRLRKATAVNCRTRLCSFSAAPRRYSQGGPAFGWPGERDMAELTSLERKDGIVTLTLNDPERMNAFSADMRRELIQRFTELNDDDECRAIVLAA